MVRFPAQTLAFLASVCMLTSAGCGKPAATKAPTPRGPEATASAVAGPRPEGPQNAPEVDLARQSGATAPSAAVPRLATPDEVAKVPDGTKMISPESGKPVTKSPSTPALVYRGRLYFFCCAVCLRKCQADPRYLDDARPPNGHPL
jgi:YHS domain-containing protein